MKRCFVLMPFEDPFTDVYTRGIEPAARDAGFECTRADSALEPKSIIREIVQGVFNADAIVADLTDANPNVFYELGVAHAIDNKTVMIARNPVSRLPFDLKSYRVIGYDHTFEGIDTKLKAKLQQAFSGLVRARESPSNPVQDFRPVAYTVPLIGQAQLEAEIRELKGEVARLEKEERRRQIITLIASLPTIELMHLKKLASAEQFDYSRRGEFLEELRHLRQLGLIRTKPGATIDGIPAHGNLKDHLEVTETVIADFFRLMDS
jgi:hypothetical protein